jgi:hypothetical protein
MGYFANGTEELAFKETYCFNCNNWRQREGEEIEVCPVMDIHFLFSYELCNSKSKGKRMLDMLIEDRDHQYCLMFSKKGDKK